MIKSSSISEAEAQQHVPFGSYCYDTVHAGGQPLKQFEETLERDHPGDFSAQFVIWVEQTKRIYCPYWRTTDYGTVCCEYLGVEAIGIGDKYWDLAVRHFGSEEATNAACTGFLLGDAVKECRLNNGDRPAKPT